jgi:SAM-dependent methyltransferase
MCLGLHLVGTHGLDRNYVYQQVPWHRWGTLHDNVHNRTELPQAAAPVENVYAPTPDDLVEPILTLAGVKAGQTVYDLGSGDGRVLVTAARLGCRAVGYEIDPELIAAARARAAAAHVDIEVRQADLFAADLSDADVIYVYLFPSPQLRAKLAEAPRARIVSYLHPTGLPGEHQHQVQHLGRQLPVWIR